MLPWCYGMTNWTSYLRKVRGGCTAPRGPAVGGSRCAAAQHRMVFVLPVCLEIHSASIMLCSLFMICAQRARHAEHTKWLARGRPPLPTARGACVTLVLLMAAT